MDYEAYHAGRRRLEGSSYEQAANFRQFGMRDLEQGNKRNALLAFADAYQHLMLAHANGNIPSEDAGLAETLRSNLESMVLELNSEAGLSYGERSGTAVRLILGVQKPESYSGQPAEMKALPPPKNYGQE